MREVMILFIMQAFVLNAQQCVQEEEVRVADGGLRIEKSLPDCNDPSTYYHREYSGSMLLREGQVIDGKRHGIWIDHTFTEELEYDHGVWMKTRGWWRTGELGSLTYRINDTLAYSISFHLSGDTADYGKMLVDHPKGLQGPVGEWIEIDEQGRFKTIRHYEPYADDSLGFWVFGTRETLPARRFSLVTGGEEKLDD